MGTDGDEAALVDSDPLPRRDAFFFFFFPTASTRVGIWLSAAKLRSDHGVTSRRGSIAFPIQG